LDDLLKPTVTTKREKDFYQSYTGLKFPIEEKEKLMQLLKVDCAVCRFIIYICFIVYFIYRILFLLSF
jgi:hypothetical protein